MKKKKNSSLILACIGSTGVALTGFLAAYQTWKARVIFEDDDLTAKEKAARAAPIYIPAVIVGLGTIGCIVGGHIVNQKAQASLASAYAMLGQSYSMYKDKVREVCDAETVEKIEHEFEGAHLTCENICRRPENNGEKHLFYDELSGAVFERTWGEILDAEYHINRNFVLKGYVSLDEFYDFLDIHPECMDLGWDIALGYSWIDFSHRMMTLDDGLECFAIEYIFPPMTEEELEEYTM